MVGDRGFTLVEMLIVVAVIGLLVALLTPALQQADAHARGVMCQQNLRQVFRGQLTYAHDHGRMTPLFHAEDPVSWRQRLTDHLYGGHAGEEARKLFQCPSVSRADLVAGGTQSSEAGFVPESIAINGAMQFSRWQFRVEAPPRQAEIIAFGDVAPSVLETTVSSDGYGVWRKGSSVGWWQAPEHLPDRAYRHGHSAANHVFMDGHTGMLGTDALIRDGRHWTWWDASGGERVADASVRFDPTPSPSPVPLIRSDGGAGPGSGDPPRAPCGCPILQ